MLSATYRNIVDAFGFANIYAELYISSCTLIWRCRNVKSTSPCLSIVINRNVHRPYEPSRLWNFCRIAISVPSKDDVQSVSRFLIALLYLRHILYVGGGVGDYAAKVKLAYVRYRYRYIAAIYAIDTSFPK